MTIQRFNTSDWRRPSWKVALIVSLVAVGAAAGCGSIAFKPGGTGGEQQAARDRCHSAGRTDSPDFERCMKEQGWSVRQLGGSPAAAGEAGVPAEALPPAEAPAAPAAAAPSPPAATNAPEGDAWRPVEVPVAPAASSVPGSASEPAGAAPTRTPVVANGWFKLGGNADALESAKRRCAAKLEASDEPTGDANTVSPEMYDCLREEGWRAVP